MSITFLDKKVDPNQVEGSSKAPLSWALERYLDAYRYSPSRISDRPGSQAVQATVKLLLERGADPNPGDGTSPILAALRLYSEDLVLLLLKAGSSPHVCDVCGRTPLIIATALGMTRVVAALLEIPDEWTSPVIADVYGRSAITEATRRNRVHILELLTRDSEVDAVASSDASECERVKVPERHRETCKVCMVPLLDASSDHCSCEQCPSFVICKDCKDWGVTCLKTGHTMDDGYGGFLEYSRYPLNLRVLCRIKFEVEGHKTLCRYLWVVPSTQQNMRLPSFEPHIPSQPKSLSGQFGMSSLTVGLGPNQPSSTSFLPNLFPHMCKAG